LGNMYTPSTQASLSERLGTRRSDRRSEVGGTEVGTRRSDRSQRTSHSATSHRSSQSYAPSSCYTDDHGEDDENPTTAEVVLAKKQLKMEAMIRKLLVQQNQADDTIAQLSDSLSRLGPSNTHQLTTKHRASSASQKFGQPVMGPQHRHSPWHQLASDQDIGKCLRAPESHRSTSSVGTRHTDSTNIHSLINPSGFNKTRQRKRVTKAPNQNPANIRAVYSARQDAGGTNQDSGLVKNALSWGDTGDRDAWEDSGERRAAIGAAQIVPKRISKSNSGQSRVRPASSCSSRSQHTAQRQKSQVGDQFGDRGLDKNAYDKLAHQNSEYFGKAATDWDT